VCVQRERERERGQAYAQTLSRDKVKGTYTATYKHTRIYKGIYGTYADPMSRGEVKGLSAAWFLGFGV
jgi:hypothetical protein